MRIWSVHPKYLDSKGLVALWRETLLAKNVLEGKTKGYRNHPQLCRFKASPNPLEAINLYLSIVYEEAITRQFNFNVNKFFRISRSILLPVNHGQLKYEFDHLLDKLRKRDLGLYHHFKNTKAIDPHPIFKIVHGEVEKWEMVRIHV